jgi:hypothetical protein
VFLEFSLVFPSDCLLCDTASTISISGIFVLWLTVLSWECALWLGPLSCYWRHVKELSVPQTSYGWAHFRPVLGF